MPKNLCLAAIALMFAICASTVNANSQWGADYFPNIELTTHDGESVRFFDDLIKDKIVVVNFIYTTCADTCPLETAQLVRVQHVLGDRLGKDVFFYSITIDPDHDTAPVLKEYRDRFRANWTFLTGKEADIIQLRKKLGLYIEDIQDGSNNHNVNMIIGNQATGRWMKRSPFENPHVLADQLGNWLTGWKAPPEGGDYANAPKLRNITPGEQLFRTRCASCHSLDGHELPDALGPDLLGVSERREAVWLLNWLRAPDQMLEANDPIATALFEKYNRVAMPNMRLNQQEAEDLIDYMDEQSRRVRRAAFLARDKSQLSRSDPISKARSFVPGQAVNDAVAVMNAWIRESQPAAKVNGGYMTLVNVGSQDLTLVSIESDAYEKIEVHEMKTANGMMKMQEVIDMIVPAQGQVKMQPGGKHLMLFGPREYFRDGQKITMTLTFKSGLQQSVLVNVMANQS